MKKMVLFVILSGLLFAGGIFWSMRSPWLLMKIARIAIGRAAPDVRVQQMSVVRQRMTLGGELFWEGVFFSALVKGRPLIIRADRIEASGLRTIFFFTQRIPVKVLSAEIDYAPAKAKGVFVDVVVSQGRETFLIDGTVMVAEGAWDKIQGAEGVLHLHGNRQTLGLTDIQVKAYGGTVTGNARVLFKPPVYTAILRMEGIDTWRLADINDQLAVQLAGRLSGSVAVAGDARQITHLDMDVDMPEGGKVNAALLSTLTQYLPQSVERKRLDVLIKTGGKLAVEVFSFTIKSQKLDHLSGEVKLKSHEANLELNLSHDILTDGTWDGLAQYWQSLLR